MPLRRDRIDLSTPAENAIRAAIDAVEAMGADERLTEAINLLTMARNRVADFVDGAGNVRVSMLLSEGIAANT